MPKRSTLAMELSFFQFVLLKVKGLKSLPILHPVNTVSILWSFVALRSLEFNTEYTREIVKSVLFFRAVSNAEARDLFYQVIIVAVALVME